MEITIASETDLVAIPNKVHDLKSFRKWAGTKGYPEKAHIWYIKGMVWLDLSREDIFRHAEVKGAYLCSIHKLLTQVEVGYYFGGGLFFASPEADLAGKPDGTFISYESLRAGRARFVPDGLGGYDELEGAADMVLEVVSRTSVQKDTVILRKAYWEAGIQEYWLVDVRNERPQFIIYRHTKRGYARVPAQGGWLRSALFARAFRLTRKTDRLGNPQFKLEVGEESHHDEPAAR